MALRLSNGVLVPRNSKLACTTQQTDRNRYLNARRCKTGYLPVPFSHFGCYGKGELGGRMRVVGLDKRWPLAEGGGGVPVTTYGPQHKHRRPRPAPTMNAPTLMASGFHTMYVRGR
jgi:hypothetical protein